MRLLQLLDQESYGERRSIVTMAALSGVANAGLLAIINAASQSASYETMNTRYLFMFVLAMTLYVITQRHIFDRGTMVFEGLVESVRLRMIGKVHGSDLLALERLGHADIYSKLTHQTGVISQSAGMIVAALQSALMVAFAAMYIAILSKAAFLLAVILVVGGVLVYLQREKETAASLQLAAQRETEFFGLVTHVIDGFKELKMSTARSAAVLGRVADVASDLRQTNQHTARLYNANYIFAQAFFYTLVAAVVFLLPRLIPTYTNVITQITAAILFIIGPLSTAVGGIPGFVKANIAAEQIAQIEAELDRQRPESEMTARAVVAPAAPPVAGAERAPRIELAAVEFTYRDRDGQPLFSVGPLDLTVQPGETVFVVGGNGSGKSTLAKLLTALYLPDRGMITSDGVRVAADNAQAYREQFSVIFSDFHLFDQLYGLAPEPAEVHALLRQMGLERKTSFENGRFTNLDLSTGQRKRLGLVVALLENRPVVVFDEWAADQDAEFRAWFYESLLGQLKERGRTVIAITHDDRYFHLADRVVRMDYGQIRVPTEAR